MNDFEGRILEYLKLNKQKFPLYHSTWQIAGYLKIFTPRARKVLNKMQKDNLVCRSKYSQKNNIIWELLEEKENG